MNSVEKVVSVQKPTIVLESIPSIDTFASWICIIFKNSLPIIEHLPETINSRKISPLTDKTLLLQFMIFEAKIVSDCWERYGEHLAKERELAKAFDKKYQRRKEELDQQTKRIEDLKKEIQQQRL